MEGSLKVAPEIAIVSKKMCLCLFISMSVLISTISPKCNLMASIKRIPLWSAFLVKKMMTWEMGTTYSSGSLLDPYICK